MKRWNERTSQADPGAPNPEMEAPRVDRFLTEITGVCRRYGLSIFVDDCEGFIVGEFKEENIKRLMCADIDLDPGDLE